MKERLKLNLVFHVMLSFIHSPKGLEKFEDLLEDFKACSTTSEVIDDDTDSSGKNDIVNSGFGEKTNRDRLIVMVDISGLADESKKFVSFLTVARKFNYTYVYIFHTIYLEKSIWRTILSYTDIFNIFPASVSLASVQKVIEGVCIRNTRNYIPQSALWISRLIKLANRNDRVCLTLDCSVINKDGPRKFRTEADRPDFKTC